MTSLEGQTFAGFEVVAKLGQGGMGAVYKARQPLLDRFVALKVMSQQLSGDPGYIARFIREAASAAKLNHPNMVQVHTAGEQGGVYYIVMEFVEGESLSQRLKRVGVLDPVEAIAITLHVTTALQHAWNKAQLIHRDIKPDNIFLSKDGEVKVGDLGLAKSVSDETTEMTQSGMMMGSPHYMSPEQARASKETDFRTDIYSLGCTLYQLLTGMTPYQADDAVGLILKHVNDPTPDLQAIMPNCPRPLVGLVNKMMAKDRNARHGSYDELIAELWQVSDIIGQQQAAATAVLTPAAASTGTTIKPTAVKAAAVVPTVKQTVAIVAPPPKKQSFKLVHAIAGVGAVVILLTGLMIWSPWKDRGASSVEREASLAAASVAESLVHRHPSPVTSPEAALKQLGNVFTNSVGAEMVYIPPGEFMMGSTKEEQAWALANGAKAEEVEREGEAPRKATIKQGFWLERTEVTVGQWKDFVAATSYKTDAEKKGYADYAPRKGQPWGRGNGLSWRDPGFGAAPQENHAVCCVSWNDAMAFCEWATERERKAGRLAAGQVVRLPTEAEWEYACRAGTQTKFWWGESEEDGKDRLNWSGTVDGFEFTAPVDAYGERGRNKFSLADMLGNVWEWCLDECDVRQAHEERYKGNSGARVLRGGAFAHTTACCRCAHRGSRSPSTSDCNLGFRVCVGVDLSGAATPTASTSPVAAPNETGILAPAETRVPALTTNPKVGEVYTLNIGSNVTMELMGIPPGEFMLGSTKEEQAWAVANGAKAEEVKREGEAPRKARIKQGFWLGRTEVTVGQWKQFVKETSCVTDAEKKGESHVPQVPGKPWAPKKGVSWRNADFGFEMRDDHPVSCISWNDAMAFCEWLDKHEQRAGRLAHGYRVRLPTEAEWEYACRGGTQTKFWWGDSKEDGKRRLNSTGKDDGYEFVAPVDSFGARGRNGFGLADMLGNVWECCLDEHDDTQAHEDLWTGNSGTRVLRGGSFGHYPVGCRCAYRCGPNPSSSNSGGGFRVVVGVDVTGSTATTASTSLAVTPKETAVLAPAETRVPALTTNPKVGEVCTLNVGSNVTMELMGIPPGEFMMGSTPEDRAWAMRHGAMKEIVRYEGEQPHKTTIKRGFWLGRTEVTVGQWKQFITATGYRTDAEKRGYAEGAKPKEQTWGCVDGLSWRAPGFAQPRDDHPVCCVSWSDTVAFCEWLIERERKAGRLPAGWVIRLPSEAEWEYACRAGTQTRFWWGDGREDGKGRLNWSETADGFEFTSPVGFYGEQGRNKFGLADMLGNVREWCLDQFDPAGAHEECYSGNPRSRVVRGGTFHNDAVGNRYAFRAPGDPNNSSSLLGFRLCVAVDVPGSAALTAPITSHESRVLAGGGNEALPK